MQTIYLSRRYGKIPDSPMLNRKMFEVNEMNECEICEQSCTFKAIVELHQRKLWHTGVLSTLAGPSWPDQVSDGAEEPLRS